MSVYEIRVKGRLDQHWATSFEGLTLTYEGDTTVLRGALADEAALHGVLTKIGNLNLHLLSVNVVETEASIAATPITTDLSAPIGSEPELLDVAPSPPAVGTPARSRKKKAGTSRKRRPRRDPP